MSNQHLGKRNALMREEEQAAYDAMPTITRCAFCDWTHEGTAGEGRAAALQHRSRAHPKLKRAPRKRPPVDVAASKLTRPLAKTDSERHAASQARQRQHRRKNEDLIPEPESEPWHGKLYGYFGKGCRGPKCKGAYRAWYQQRKKAA